MRRRVLALVALISGFTSYGIERNPLGPPGGAIIRDAGFYVAIAKNGEYGGRPYRGSGRAVTQSVAVALAKRVFRVETAQRRRSIEESLQTASDRNLKYLVIPTILHWEERATEWTGLPDRISVRVVFVDSVSGDG